MTWWGTHGIRNCWSRLPEGSSHGNPVLPILSLRCYLSGVLAGLQRFSAPKPTGYSEEAADCIHMCRSFKCVDVSIYSVLFFKVDVVLVSHECGWTGAGQTLLVRLPHLQQEGKDVPSKSRMSSN